MKQYIYFFLLFSLPVVLLAQPEGGTRPPMPQGMGAPAGGVVKGYVTDDNAKPLEYALIYVLKASDSTVVTGVTSQKDGNFLIEQVPFGEFLLKIESMGYKFPEAGHDTKGDFAGSRGCDCQERDAADQPR